MSSLKVAFISHSFGRDLESLGVDRNHLQNRELDLRFYYKSGGCFDYFIDWPPQLHELVEFKPAIIFIALGGNSLKETVPLSKLKDNAKVFLEILRNNLPNAKLVPVQVELRFLTVENRFGTPKYETYKVLRDRFNKILQGLKERDYFCCIAGKNRLDDRKYYRSDLIHLNRLGLELYMRFIYRTITYISSKHPEL